ncbi:MAG: methyl-accepting chemotaxis protein [Candidatus Acidiferrum sp.]|jgi:methyl-accepting chemotaxis protein
MRNLGIKAKIWLSIAIFGVGYAAILIIQLWAASQTASHMAIASGTLFPAALSIQEGEAGFQKVKKHYNDAVLLQDKKSLAAADQDGQTLLAALQSVKGKVGLAPSLQKDVSDAIDKFTDIQERAKPLYTAMIDKPDSISDANQAAIGALARENKDLEALLAALREKVSTAFRAELDAVTVWSQRQRNFGLVVIVGALAVGISFASFVIDRQIVNPLKVLAVRLKDIAEGEGDLTRRVDASSHDEIGEVAKWFNTFMDKLQRVISSVGANTNGVATSSEKLTVIGQTVSANAEETSSQANQVSTAAQQVSRNLQTVATGTGEMTSSIQDIARNATEAAKIAREAVGMATAANETVAKLGTASAEIGNVVKEITAIAQKTDLLALNATIEAARAGAAGAGFEVVANEVKELAAKTAQATEGISHRIAAIQEGTSDAVTAIAAIGSIIGQINDIASTIAAAVEEQNATTVEISRNIDEAARVSETITQNISGVAQAAQGTSHSVGDSQKSVIELAKMSSELHELVGQFKY